MHSPKQSILASIHRDPILGPSLPSLITQGDMKTRLTLARSCHTRRLRDCRGNRQFMLKDHWPTLRPASLPAHRRRDTRTPLFSRSLCSMGWKRDPNCKIRHDPPMRDIFPFPHSPPGSPSHETTSSPPTGNCPSLCPLGALPQETDSKEASPRLAPQTRVVHLTSQGIPPQTPDTDTPSSDAPSADSFAYTLLTFLTRNAQKTGANSPSLADVIRLLDKNDPDVLFLIETPPHSRSGPLTHVLRNRGCHIHNHPANAQSPLDILP
jgi:hypothetical protein